jgi:hypothetical protein
MIRLATLILAASALLAQDAPPSQSPQSTKESGPKPFVRRFSAGGLLSITGLSLMDSRSLSQTAASGATTTYSTTYKGHRFGGGVVLQYALTDRYALAGSFLLRRVRFESNNEVTQSSKTTKLDDVSSADYWDFPLLLRRYGKPRSEPGPRWFADAGLTFRRVRNVRSSLQTTTSDSKVSCCDERPVSVANRLSAGLTVGAGIQLVDQLGIRFIPMVRFTRWVQPAFDTLSVQSGRNQIEAGLAITF